MSCFKMFFRIAAYFFAMQMDERSQRGVFDDQGREAQREMRGMS